MGEAAATCIADMTAEEKLAAVRQDSRAFYEQAFAEERPRAAAQVEQRLKRLRSELGQSGLTRIETNL